MGRPRVIANESRADAIPPAYVPSFELTEGQPPPVAANGGVSYMSFDKDGDAGTSAATVDAFDQIATGEGQAVIDMIDNAPPGPIETQWGLGFRTYDECLAYIRDMNMEAPEGGLALPLRYTVHEAPSYSIVSSNALWQDPARKADQMALRKEERDNRSPMPLFPPGASRRPADGGVPPGSQARQRRMHGQARCRARALRVQVRELLRLGGGGTGFLPRDRKAALRLLPRRHRRPGLQPRRVQQGLRRRSQGGSGQQEPGCEPGLREPRAQRPERQQRPRALPRVADQEPAQFRAYSALHRGTSRREDVATLHVDQSRQAHGDRRPVSLRALRLAFVRRPAVHHELPHLRRPRRRDHPLHLPARPRVVLVPPAEDPPRSPC